MAKKTSYTGNIESLVQDDKNFNKHTAQGMQMLEQSIGRHGFGRSVFCDKNNVLIGGNGVVETASRLGKKKIRFVETDGDELVVVKRTDIDINSKEGRELALADNATAAIDLDWDEDMMQEVRQEVDIEFEDWGLDLPPLDGEEDDSDSTSGSDLEDEVSSIPTPKNTARPFERKASMGDVWELGGHRVMVGGACNANLKTLMGDSLASMLFTNTQGMMANAQTFSSCIGALVDGAPYYIWTHPDDLVDVLSYVDDSSLQYSSTLIWVKNEPHIARKDYAGKYEPCVYGWKPGAAHRWYGGNKAQDVMTYPALPLGTASLFTLPVDLVKYLFENSSQKGDIILDPIGGGSTLCAAQEMGRRAYMLSPNADEADMLIAVYLGFLKDGEEDVYLIKEDGTKIPYDEVKSKH